MSDGTYTSRHTVEISTINTAPVAVITVPYVTAPFYDGQKITLYGTGSRDAERDPLTYTWTLTNQPDGSTPVFMPNGSTAQLVINGLGDYIVSLVVTDSFGVSSSVKNYLLTAKNRRPVADAGDDRSTNVGRTVTLSGLRSSDPDGDDLTYRWVILAKPYGSQVSGTFSDFSAVEPSFFVDKEGTYTFMLQVYDGEYWSTSHYSAYDLRTVHMQAPTW